MSSLDFGSGWPNASETHPAVMSPTLSSPPRDPPSTGEIVNSAGPPQLDNQEPRDSNTPTSRAAISNACMPCRSRHLKCDGQEPCSRCRHEGASCHYVASRRGWKPAGKTKKGQMRAARAAAANAAASGEYRLFSLAGRLNL
jgi:hypothetical protein